MLSESAPFRKKRGVSSQRRYFVGGSDARIGDDEAALIRLWREKRGQIEPEDLSANFIVQLGLATENLSRRWYAANTYQTIANVQNSRVEDQLLSYSNAKR